MALQLVSTVTVGSGGAASIEFTGIPQTGKDLLLLLSTRSASSNVYSTLTVSINSDFTLGRHTYRQLYGTGSSVASDNGALFGGYVGEVTGANATANTFGNASVYFTNYTGSTQKSFSVDGVTENNATQAFANILAGNYNQTTAVTSLFIDVYDTTNFAQHSTASLYIIS